MKMWLGDPVNTNIYIYIHTHTHTHIYYVYIYICTYILGFPWWSSGASPMSLSGKESICNAGDTGDVGLIAGSGRSPREENGNLL